MVIGHQQSLILKSGSSIQRKAQLAETFLAYGALRITSICVTMVFVALERRHLMVRTQSYTGTGPIIRNRLLHIGFLIFRKLCIYPQAFSFDPTLADAN